MRAYIHLMLKQYELGMIDVKASKDLAYEINNDEQVAFMIIREAQFLSATGHLQAAIDSCETAYQMYVEQDNLQQQLYALGVKRAMQADNGQWEEAYHTLADVFRHQEKVFNETTAKNTSKYEVEFKTAEKEKALAETQLKLANRQKWIYGLGSGALALLFLGLFINQRSKRKAEMEKDRILREEQEQRMKAVIEAENKERTRIAQDLHDGVAQSMAAVRMRVSAWEDEVLETEEITNEDYADTLKLIDQTCDEVRSISHQMMPAILRKKGLILALDQLANHFEKSFGIKTMFTHRFDPATRFSEITESTLYRITQELLNNSYKHAGAQAINIDLSARDAFLELYYRDDGKGMDLSLNSKSTAGLDGIKNRAEIVNGTVELASSPGKGIQYKISVPK